MPNLYLIVLEPVFSFFRPAPGAIILLEATKWLTVHHLRDFFDIKYKVA